MHAKKLEGIMVVGANDFFDLLGRELCVHCFMKAVG